MAIGDVRSVPDCPGLHYVDTGMFDTPWYGAVYVLDGPRPALVDAGIGADRERVLAALDGLGLAPADVEAVLLTHVHLDHAGGSGHLAERCDATVYAHEAGAPHLRDPQRLVAGTKTAVGDMWEYYEPPRPLDAERVVELGGGDAVDLGDRTLTAHRAPGHAPHQVVYRDDRSGGVFVGDAAGVWVPPRERVVETTPPPQFDLDACLADLDTIRGLDPTALFYPHFGPGPDDVDGVLDDYAAVLRSWVEHVRGLRAEMDDGAVLDRVAREADLASVWGARKARGEARLNARGVLSYLDASDPG